MASACFNTGAHLMTLLSPKAECLFYFWAHLFVVPSGACLIPEPKPYHLLFPPFAFLPSVSSGTPMFLLHLRIWEAPPRWGISVMGLRVWSTPSPLHLKEWRLREHPESGGGHPWMNAGMAEAVLVEKERLLFSIEKSNGFFNTQ